ncbi:MAG: sulfatase-like hydrolase/transferase [Phycisphaerae bacterium]|nr:sulfatase-like hydrolase/transferase [Phycisphaerae bacterium]
MKRDKPNVLFIFTDQHRLSAIGAYGETPCRTPNLNRLAREGVRFEKAYTTCPVCSPARGTILTGQYPHSHGICSNVHNLGCSIHELEDRPELLSRKLEAEGYSLGYTGKWHLGTDNDSAYGGTNTQSLPSTVGFEGQDFPGHGNGGFGYPEYKAYLEENGFEHKIKPWTDDSSHIWVSGELEGPVESTVPYFLVENTISLMKDFQKRDDPFFIWHNFWGPHSPYYVPKEFIDMYRDVEIPPWPNYEWPSRSIPGPHHVKIHPDQEHLSWEDWAMEIRYYYAFTTLIDHQIGRLYEHMEAEGLLDNTVIIFAADHGETLGSHGGLTDKGWHHFEETHRIPFIIRFPDGNGKGKVIKDFATLADFYPTVLELAGGRCDDDSNIHGRSLLPLIDGTADDWPDIAVTEFGGVNQSATTQRTIRHGDIKYGYNCTNEDELYDLAVDPNETRNLIHHPDYHDRANEMRHRLMDWMRETGDPAGQLYELTLCHHDKDFVSAGYECIRAGKKQ